MKQRTQFLLIVGMLVLLSGIIWSTYPRRKPQPASILGATIRRDCAPWDGAAFSVSIPMENGNTVQVSIWRSPEIRFPVGYSFPDASGNVGNAFLLSNSEAAQQLAGDVWFSSIQEGQPVAGEIRLQSEGGALFKGKFLAEWEDLAALCG